MAICFRVNVIDVIGNDIAGVGGYYAVVAGTVIHGKILFMPESIALLDTAVIHATKVWLEVAVIGLNLCPFAKAVHRKNQIRYIVSKATDREALEIDFISELNLLFATDAQEIDTTLLIHPYVLQDFFDYNGFLKVADRLIDRQGLRGEIQIASFHPLYEFAHCAADAPENCTNRSPYPMLHLLRETSIERAIASFPDAGEIYRRNIDTLQKLGLDGWNQLFNESPGPSVKNRFE